MASRYLRRRMVTCSIRSVTLSQAPLSVRRPGIAVRGDTIQLYRGTTSPS
jgi:hypothetical protein